MSQIPLNLLIDSSKSGLAVCTHHVAHAHDLPIHEDGDDARPSEEPHCDQVESNVDLDVRFQLDQLCLVSHSLLDIVLEGSHRYYWRVWLARQDVLEQGRDLEIAMDDQWHVEDEVCLTCHCYYSQIGKHLQVLVKDNLLQKLLVELGNAMSLDESNCYRRESQPVCVHPEGQSDEEDGP